MQEPVPIAAGEAESITGQFSQLVVTRYVVEGGQVGVDIVGFGDAEVDVEGEGLVPVVAGMVGIAGGVVGLGETVVGAALLVAVAELGGQGERGVVVGAGLLGAAGGVVGLADAVEGTGFAGPVAEFTEQDLSLIHI